MKDVILKINLFIYVLIFLNIVASAYWLIQGDIHYDIDVSRDLLVMNDIIKNKHLTLLGPRSGAIPGIFHGPLWFYVNLPAFIIGGGNPLAVGWFWLLLSILFLFTIYLVAKSLFDAKVALLSVLFYSVNSIINPSIGLKNFYNPYGAVFLFPVFFWFFYQYVTKLHVRYLILTLFMLGLMIQFQMAFGVPVFIAITIYFGYYFNKNKKILHLFAYLILLIPLSTFILFDIKHNGLQLNSLMQYLNSERVQSQNIINTLGNRLEAIVFDSVGELSAQNDLIAIITTIFFIVFFMIAIIKNTYKNKSIYWLFGYIYLGFWIISLFYSGNVGNYYWPFLPLLIIIFCSFYRIVKKIYFIPILIILYFVNLHSALLAIINFKTDINFRGPHSWAFNLMVAERIYNDAKGDFGYFNFSPDRYAYQQKYAMIYTQNKYPDKIAYSSSKHPLTYLIEVDPPRDRPELNGVSWRISDIGIDRMPDQILRFDFIQVEKYFLNDNEIKVAPNPYLLNEVFLR